MKRAIHNRFNDRHRDDPENDPAKALTPPRRRWHYGQPAPAWECRRRDGRAHYDARCSVPCRWSWANREAHIDIAVWRDWEWESVTRHYAGTLRARGDLSPADHRRIRTRFLAGLRRWAKANNARVLVRCVAEVGADGTIHDHHVAGTDRPLPARVFRGIYQEAAEGRPVRVHHAPARNLEASVRYQFKATEDARHGTELVRLHRVPRFQLLWGSKNFTPGGKPTRAAQWRAQCRVWAGDAYIGPDDPSEVPNEPEPALAAA